MRILQNMLTALVSAPNRMRALGWGQPANLAKDPHSAVEAVLSATGQVSSLVYAGTLLGLIYLFRQYDLSRGILIIFIFAFPLFMYLLLLLLNLGNVRKIFDVKFVKGVQLFILIVS